MKALLLLLPLLASCELPSVYYAKSASGNIVYEKRTGMLGGTRTHSRSDGSIESVALENSFRDGATAVGLGIGAYQAVKINGSNNALTASQSANAASVTNTTTKANAAVQLGKQKPVIITPPQQAVFPP